MNHNANASMIKRIMAAALALAIMLTTLGGYAPGWFSAFAEDGAALEGVASQDQYAAEAQGPSTGGTSGEEPLGEATSSVTADAVRPSPEGKAGKDAPAVQQPSPDREAGSAPAQAEAAPAADAPAQSDASAAHEPSPEGEGGSAAG